MVKSFVEKYKAYALKAQEKSGIDYRFFLAQSALETGWGKKAPGNSFFGVKASKDTPESQRICFQTTEYIKGTKTSLKDCFLKFASPEESFKYQADFFLTKKRYAKALLVRQNPYLFAEEIHKAGYATDPNYAYKLQTIMRQIDPTLPVPSKKN